MFEVDTGIVLVSRSAFITAASSARKCSDVVMFVTAIVLVFTPIMCTNAGATSAVGEFSGGLVLICTAWGSVYYICHGFI